MANKLSGAENRKRKTQQDQAFQETIKSMSLEKYIKIDKSINGPSSTSSNITESQNTDNSQNSIDKSVNKPSTSSNVIISQDTESLFSAVDSQNKSVCSNSLGKKTDSEIDFSENMI